VKPLSTTAAARMLSVSSRTVAAWIDTGLLKGFRIPGSKHRRVTVAELEAFAKQHGVPLATSAAEAKS
jgi:excisionase family DNA binding protein